MVSAAAGVVQAVTGFGSAILIMMVLPYFFDMLKAPALCSAITFGFTASMAWRFRREVKPQLVLFPALCYEAGSVIVLNLARNLALDAIGVAFGVFLIVLSLYFLLLSKTISITAGMGSAAVCGMISGACSGLFGIGGPLMAVYFLAATRTKEEYAGNLQFVFALTTAVNFGIRVYKGFYTLDLVPLTLWGMAGITLGKMAGLKILDRINIERMGKLIYLLVGLSGVMTLAEHLV